MKNMAYRLAELERKLENLQMVGVVTKVDYATARVKVACGSLLSNWLPWFTHRAGSNRDWWPPEVGEQVMLLSPGGDPAQGVVLPAIYQTAHPAPAANKDQRRVEFADGAFVEYDQEGGQLTINIIGDAQINIGGKASITGEGTVEIIGKKAGTVKGTVQGDCLCCYTGYPHPHISPSVKESF